jgi:hypothetical protein
MKFMHKFFNRLDSPWVDLIWKNHYNGEGLLTFTNKGSFWWKDMIKLLSKFKTDVLPLFGLITGTIDNSCPATPELLSFATNKNITSSTSRIVSHLSELFQLPLFTQAFHQFLKIQYDLQLLRGDPPGFDVWIYPWGLLFSLVKADSSKNP